MGFKAPIYKYVYSTKDSTQSVPSSAANESDSIGLFSENGLFMLKSEQEKAKLIKMFYRLSQNRSAFLRDQIREKQLEKIKPTETFTPQINKNSERIERMKMNTQERRIPRYEVLFEKGKMYKVNREQKALMAMEGQELLEDQEYYNLEEIDQSNARQQQELREAIRDIKLGKYTDALKDEGDDNKADDDIKQQQKAEKQENVQHSFAPVVSGQNLVTPIKDNFAEVKEEEVEESPDIKSHVLHTSAKKTNLREGIDNIVEVEPITPDTNYQRHDLSKEIEEEYKTGIKSAHEKYEGEGEEYDHEEVEEDGEGEGEEVGSFDYML